MMHGAHPIGKKCTIHELHAHKQKNHRSAVGLEHFRGERMYEIFTSISLHCCSFKMLLDIHKRMLYYWTKWNYWNLSNYTHILNYPIIETKYVQTNYWTKLSVNCSNSESFFCGGSHIRFLKFARGLWIDSRSLNPITEGREEGTISTTLLIDSMVLKKGSGLPMLWLTKHNTAYGSIQCTWAFSNRLLEWYTWFFSIQH